MIISNDIVLNVLISKDNNRFVPDDYYVTSLMKSRFTDPMAFFRGPNWTVTRYNIIIGYGVPEECVEYGGYIYNKLLDYFVCEKYMRSYKNKSVYEEVC